jgi:NAD(P)-dependent dehydrogenase (short-subunit alcohol dehydrogenase family)
MQISLDGKTALVTGASRGIGKAIARQFAASGANVMLSSRKQDALEAAAAEIAAAGAVGETAVFAANAGRTEDAAATVQATIERFGGLDILVNNAATNPYFGPTLDVDTARYDKTFEVNLRGPLFWSQQAWLAAFRDRPGVILNIASVGGMRTEHSLGVYNLTKAGLIHLTRQLALELGPTRVVGIAPGLVNTDFAAVLVENFGESLSQRLPLKRIGEPADVANLATFLVSDLASWITGDTYVIDGGSGVMGGGVT